MKWKNVALTLFLAAAALVLPGRCYADLEVSAEDIEYGGKRLEITCWTDLEDVVPDVYVMADKDSYKAKYDAEEDSFYVDFPKYYKIGTSIHIQGSAWNEEYETYDIDGEDIEVTAPEDTGYFYEWISKKSKKVKVTVYNAHKNDRIMVKIGKKTYSKTIPADYEEKDFSVPIKKAKGGTKMTVWLVNQYNQVLADPDSDVVYTYTKLKKKMTKKKVLLTLGWRYPKSKYKTSRIESWGYDKNGDGYTDSWLYFRKGKLYNWSIKTK